MEPSLVRNDNFTICARDDIGGRVKFAVLPNIKVIHQSKGKFSVTRVCWTEQNYNGKQTDMINNILRKSKYCQIAACKIYMDKLMYRKAMIVAK